MCTYIFRHLYITKKASSHATMRMCAMRIVHLNLSGDTNRMRSKHDDSTRTRCSAIFALAPSAYLLGGESKFKYRFTLTWRNTFELHATRKGTERNARNDVCGFAHAHTRGGRSLLNVGSLACRPQKGYYANVIHGRPEEEIRR